MQNNKTYSSVKESSDLDDWLKSYGQKKDLGISPYVWSLCKTKKVRRRPNFHVKLLISL